MSNLFRNPLLWIAIIGLIITGNAILQLQKPESIPEPLFKPAQNPFLQAIAAPGLIESREENTRIGVPLSGLVEEVRVKIWQKVEMGEVLFKLDDTELLAQQVVQQADLQVRERELEKYLALESRTESVKGYDVVPEEEIDNRSKDRSIALARRDAAKAALQQTEMLLDRLIIRAPTRGTILQINTRKGESLSPSSATAPIVMGNIDLLQIRAEVDEQLAPRIREKNEAFAYLKGETQSPIPLVFSHIEPLIVPKRNLSGDSSEKLDTRVLQVVYTILNPERYPVYVGQQVNLFIKP